MKYAEGFGRIDSYKSCVEQAARELPDWLNEITDHLGKDYNPKREAFRFILEAARMDKNLANSKFAEFYNWLNDNYVLKTWEPL